MSDCKFPPGEYVTRGELKAVVLGRSPDKHYPLVGFVCYGENEAEPVDWTEDGLEFSSDESRRDLMLPKRHRYAYCYEKTIGQFMRSINELRVHPLRQSETICRVEVRGDDSLDWQTFDVLSVDQARKQWGTNTAQGEGTR